MMTTDIKPILEGMRPLSRLDHPREMIRQFTPNWFAATMGTGILALALPQMPGIGASLKPVGEVMWFFNIGLFTFYRALYRALDPVRPRSAAHLRAQYRIDVHRHDPDGPRHDHQRLSRIRYRALRRGHRAGRHGLVVDRRRHGGCGVLIPYFMFTRHQHSLDGMTAVWLLPVVAAEVTAASGGLLAPHLAQGSAQFGMLVTSYILWAYSVPVAFSILALLILRMALHKLPHEGMAASSWLARPHRHRRAGHAGSGRRCACDHGPGGDVVAQGIGTIAGLALGFGLWWLALASLITWRYWRAGIPFNLGWWGYTFPLGVFTVATFRLGTTLNLAFFGIVGTALTLALALMWIVVAAKTLIGGWRGNLFVSPCIAATN
jgi:tellurite resistance protein TehA-like permease